MLKFEEAPAFASFGRGCKKMEFVRVNLEGGAGRDKVFAPS